MQTFQKFAQVLNTIQALLMSLAYLSTCLQVTADMHSFVFMEIVLEIVRNIRELISNWGSELRAITRRNKKE